MKPYYIYTQPGLQQSFSLESNHLKGKSSFAQPGRARAGFTLVEIMVVLLIILIIILLTIPNIVRARMDSNEFAAIGNLRSLFTAIQMYYTDTKMGYPSSLADLNGEDDKAGYISEQMATTGKKSGYVFIYKFVDKNTFYINANPEFPGKTGRRFFYIDQSNMLRENPSAEAGENDPIIQ